MIAGEYPHGYVVLPAYGFAESIGISRILASQHFPSDVLVGQAIGFLSGSYVLNHRALYRPSAKKTPTSRLIDSVAPITDPRTHSVGLLSKFHWDVNVFSSKIGGPCRAGCSTSHRSGGRLLLP